MRIRLFVLTAMDEQPHVTPATNLDAAVTAGSPGADRPEPGSGTGSAVHSEAPSPAPPSHSAGAISRASIFSMFLPVAAVGATEPAPTVAQLAAEASKQRTAQWVSDIESWELTVRKRGRQIADSIRKFGVPDTLRHTVWPLLVHSRAQLVDGVQVNLRNFKATTKVRVLNCFLFCSISITHFSGVSQLPISDPANLTC